MSGWYLAWCQIKCNPLRCGLMAFGVVMAAAVMTAVVLLIAGVNEGITKTTERLGADIMVVPRGEKIAQKFNDALLTGTPVTFYLETSTVEKIAKIQGVEHVSSQIFVETLTNARCCAGKFFIVGFDPETDFTVTAWLKDKILPGSADGQNWMIVGDRILLRQGDVANFYGMPFTVAGVLEPTGTGMDWTIYISQRALRKMVSDSRANAEMPLRISDNEVSAVFIETDDDVDLIDLAERIEQIAPEAQAILSSTVGKLARAQLAGISGVLGSVVAGLWVMALILSGVLFSMAVRERKSQIGLLVAKGADKRFILGILTKESVLIAAVSSLSGCFLGLIIVLSFRELLSHALGAADVLPTTVTTAVFVTMLSLFSTATAVVTSIIPVMPILRMEPYEAIRQGKAT